MPRRSSARSHSITSQESYAAVMIADVVADVAVESVAEEDEPQGKEVTNLAYDGHLDGEGTSPNGNDAVQKSNGSSISKGVILNAVQFGQNDSKSEEKSIPMSTSMQVPEIKQTVEEPKGFKDMSLGRKVAFGFSFLPSIFFVLCFAIILPCKMPKPCIEEKWKVELNDTGFTSRLETPDNIVFTAFKNSKNVFIQLDKVNGKLKEVEVFDNPTYLTCGKLTNKETRDCMVMDETGNFYLFNNNLDKITNNFNLTKGENATSPAILSGCSEGLEDVAIAVGNSTINILHNGNNVSQFNSVDCDSVPIRLTSWVINGSSNIVFICEKDGEDRLISVPKNGWCAFAGVPQEKPVILQSGVLDSLKQSVFVPIKDGIVIWSGSEASMIQPNGSVLWTASNLSHTVENRFVLHGEFLGGHHIAFISSSLSSGFEVTLLDPANGNLVRQFSHPEVEATEVIRVEGKKRDFALLLLKKAAQYSVSRALNQIKDISTTIVNLVSNEEPASATQGPISEELALFDFDGNIDTIKFLKDIKDGAYKSAMAAVHDKNTGVLSIYFVSTSSESSAKKFTEVRNIDVANWDKSTKSKCKL